LSLTDPVSGAVEVLANIPNDLNYTEILTRGSGPAVSIAFDRTRDSEQNIVYHQNGQSYAAEQFQNLFSPECKDENTIVRVYASGESTLGIVSENRNNGGLKCSAIVYDLESPSGIKAISLKNTVFTNRRGNDEFSMEKSFMPLCMSRDGRTIIGSLHTQEITYQSNEYRSFRASDFALLRVNYSRGTTQAKPLLKYSVVFESEFNYWNCATTPAGTFEVQISRGEGWRTNGAFDRSSLQHNLVNGVELDDKAFAMSYGTYGAVFNASLDFDGVPEEGVPEKFMFVSWDGQTSLEFPDDADSELSVFRSGDYLCLAWRHSGGIRSECSAAEFQ